MDWSKYEKDKDGFMDLNSESLASEKDEYRFACYPLVIDETPMYFKWDASVDYTNHNLKGPLHILGENGTLAKGEAGLLSEIYIPKLAKKFGLKSVEYRLAKYTDNNGKDRYGLISEDCRVKYNKALLMDDALREKRLHSINLKMLHEEKIVSCDKRSFMEQCKSDVVDKFDTLVCFDFSTSQYDRHASNLFVTQSFDSKLYDDILLLDNINNITTFFVYKKTFVQILHYTAKRILFGIEQGSERLSNFLREVEESKYIHTKNIKNFLETGSKLLTNNCARKEIHNEIVEEYGENVYIPKLYEDNFFTAFNYRMEQLNESFEKRHIDECMEI